ncbi:MAG: cyanophycinase [Thermoplasmatota archaeon]
MPKGTIISMGGNVKLSPEETLFKKFIDISSHGSDYEPRLGIVPTASGNPIRSGKKYSELFEKMGAEVYILHPVERESANSKSLISKAEEVDSFFFTGGNQLRLTTVLGGTNLLDTIKNKFEEGCTLAGTSAGAVCMTSTMIAHGLAEDALMIGEVELTRGLAFIENAVIDTHFTARGRFPRLFHVVTENPGVLGIGLGEETGIVWDFENTSFTVLGNRNIVIVDGKTICFSNTADTEPGKPFTTEGITVHILSDGFQFDFDERIVVPPNKGKYKISQGKKTAKIEQDE